jgi:hypothetical protein
MNVLKYCQRIFLPSISSNDFTCFFALLLSSFKNKGKFSSCDFTFKTLEESWEAHEKMAVLGSAFVVRANQDIVSYY